MLGNHLLGRLLGFAVILVIFAVRLGLIFPGAPNARGVPDVSPKGFAGDVSQPPRIGTWRAVGTYKMSKGYNGRAVGEQIVRSWSTRKDCPSGPCSYWITRELEGLPPTTARLTLKHDGWHAQFPELVLPCQPGHSWAQRDTFIFRFTAGGTRLRAHEGSTSFASACGYGVARVEWTGERVPSRVYSADAPAPAGPEPKPVSASEKMAASVKPAVQRDIRRIGLRVSAARGRRVELRDTFYATCSVPRSTRAFPCRVNVDTPDNAAPMFTLRLVVRKTNGRCWRATNDTFIEPGSGIFHYRNSKLQRKLAKPLRGCV